MADQPNAVLEPETKPKVDPNPSGAPTMKAGTGIIFAKSPDLKPELWNSAQVTEVFPDQGTCHAIVNMRGGTTPKWSLHYADDPRLKDNPHWLPNHEPDSGVWRLSETEQLIRNNQVKLARIEELLAGLTEDVANAVKMTERNAASIQNWVQEKLAVAARETSSREAALTAKVDALSSELAEATKSNKPAAQSKKGPDKA